jgi:16S rRNA (adenine(1408)-N(1))-methyltransferase
VVGIDANAGAMRESSLRADRPTARGGLPNALFLAAAAEMPPAALCGRADLLTITLPWGSLLHGALALDEDAAAGIAGLIAPAGAVEALISVADRDAARLGIAPLRASDGDAIADRWACHGLVVAGFEPAASDEAAVTGSTWARRLTAGDRTSDRAIWRLSLRSPESSSGRR